MLSKIKHFVCKTNCTNKYVFTTMKCDSKDRTVQSRNQEPDNKQRKPVGHGLILLHDQSQNFYRSIRSTLICLLYHPKQFKLASNIILLSQPPELQVYWNYTCIPSCLACNFFLTQKILFGMNQKFNLGSKMFCLLLLFYVYDCLPASVPMHRVHT